MATTTDSVERKLTTSALASYYLQEVGGEAGLDSAIVVLQADSSAAFSTWLTQLLARVEAGYSSRPTTGYSTRQLPTKAVTASRALAPDYFARVIELLGPLGSDSARAAAVQTDEPLHAELLAMAEDSLTWGSHAARTALNLYTGTHYSVWYVDATDPEEVARTAAAEPLAVTARLTAVPNPSDGNVTVQYRLAKATKSAELVVYDAWGISVARRAVNPDTTSAELQLNVRAGFYHAVLVADGVIVARERLLLTGR